LDFSLIMMGLRRIKLRECDLFQEVKDWKLLAV
jgi:hypothetical protein